jgi:regulator of protease activity HflC (stomatin/prohibitin superfamily)
MFVFAELVRDMDRNKGNVVYTRDWKVVMIDFSRAFRLERTLRSPAALQICDRQLLARMEQLTNDAVRRAAGNHLTGFEIDSLIARRDLIVQHFRKLVQERGEERVLY